MSIVVSDVDNGKLVDSVVISSVKLNVVDSSVVVLAFEVGKVVDSVVVSISELDRGTVSVLDSAVDVT